MKNIQEIQTILNHANGTEQYHYVSQVPNAPVVTDGIYALAEATECFWLFDAIISYQGDKRLTDPDFQVWKLTVIETDELRSATLESFDQDKKVIIKQVIENTDFPLDEITIWVLSGGPHGLRVIMLPSEY